MFENLLFVSTAVLFLIETLSILNKHLLLNYLFVPVAGYTKEWEILSLVKHFCFTSEVFRTTNPKEEAD